MFFKKNLTAFVLFMVVLVAGQTIIFNGFYVPVKINFVLTVNMMLFAGEMTQMKNFWYLKQKVKYLNSHSVIGMPV